MRISIGEGVGAGVIGEGVGSGVKPPTGDGFPLVVGNTEEEGTDDGLSDGTIDLEGIMLGLSVGVLSLAASQDPSNS